MVEKTEILKTFKDESGLEINMSKVEYIKTATGSGFPLRITKKKAHSMKSGGIKSPRLLVGCGCCNEKVEIYYDAIPSKNSHKDGLEINGVNGTVHQWRKVLLPLLGIKIPKGNK